MDKNRKPPDNTFEIFKDAWLGWRDKSGKKAPPKSAISMRDIVPILPYVALFDFVEGRGVKHRLVGEQINLHFSADVRNEASVESSLLHEEQIELHVAFSKAIKNTPQGFNVKRKIVPKDPTSSELGWFSEIIIVPIADEEGAIAHGIYTHVASIEGGLDDWAWAKLVKLDDADKEIVHVRPVDIGFGVYDLSGIIPDSIAYLPPLELK